MKKIILHHHLGLGDHFVCNGLVNKLSEECDTIYLPCKSHNYETIKYLYSENPKVEVFKIDENEFNEVGLFSSLLEIPILMVGFENHSPTNWDKSFYEQLKIDFSERYNSFSLPRKYPNSVIEPPKNDYILVHSQSSTGKYDLNIDTSLDIVEIENGVSDNLFSYLKIIKKAKKIHCINSSVFHLIDSLTDITYNLYYHDVRKDDCTNFKVSDKWKIIK